MPLVRCAICDLTVASEEVLVEGWREVAVTWAPSEGTCWYCRECFAEATGL